MTSATVEKPTATQRFVESLRTIRKARGLTLQQVCDLPRVSATKTGLWELENGKRKRISLDEATELSSALGFPLEQMIDGSAPRYDGLPEIVADLVDRLDAITNAHK